jgi:hypothetical protein
MMEATAAEVVRVGEGILRNHAEGVDQVVDVEEEAEEAAVMLGGGKEEEEQ